MQVATCSLSDVSVAYLDYRVRPHASCNMLTPMEAELHRGKLKKDGEKENTNKKK
ncbi:hypothetical protein EZS27_026578 [termite gut metagenome]|uniref:Integrase catalytic domain-containing protein n=1 Tax=termite gut metagenome TaxID=433724 RepID=A0A5J4QR88_9ZZZZ